MTRRWVQSVSRDILRAAFREYFGVSEEHVDILIVLYARPGEWVKVKRLQVLLDSHRPPKRQAVYERIRVLREVMDSESLVSGGQLDDLGYALSEIGFEECRMALRAMAEALVRDGPDLRIEGAEVVEINTGLTRALINPLADHGSADSAPLRSLPARAS